MQSQRRTFKTKMCNLYQKGRCSRLNCNFAHGDTELRRFGGGSHSFNGRRDYRDDDLRVRLERRHSPNRRYSPERDGRNRHGFHGQRIAPRDAGSSHSRSPIRKSERMHRRREPEDGNIDEIHTISDSALNRKNEDRDSTHDDRLDQLKHVQSEIERLEDDKSQLHNFLEEKIDETHMLSLRIEELETQLNMEQRECNRVISKVKKFVRAHGTYLKAQEELKRSQTLLQKLADQLGADISEPGETDEDTNFNILSDKDTNFDNRRSPRYIELKNDISSVKKRSYVSSVANDAHTGNQSKRGRYSGMATRPEGPAQSEYNANKEIESNMENQTKKQANRSISDDHSYKRGRNNGREKTKYSDGRGSMPSTSIAAHEDEDVTNSLDVEDTNDNVNVDNKVNPSSLPSPSPPIDLNDDKQQHDADNKDADVGKGESEMLDIDLNDEIEIV